MFFMFKSENFYKFSGLSIILIGYIRVSATGDFNQGRYFILIGLMIQIIGSVIYFYKKQK